MTEEKKANESTGLERNLSVASILDVTSDFLYVESVDAILQKIVKTVSETYGLERVHVGIREEDTGLFSVRAAYGFDPGAEEQLMKVKYTIERMNRDLKPELKIGRNAFYVPAENWEPDEEDLIFVAHPERMDRARILPDDWLECDYIDFLMYEKDGSLLGYLEIDEPDDHKMPSEETIRAIEVFTDLAAIAIQNARLYSKVQDERKKIELLLDLIGHDVNNYAQGVSGFIELAMARPDIPQPARKSLAKAHDQILNLNKLVRNVKVYAIVESASAKEVHPLDILEMVKEAFEGIQASTRNKNVVMVLEDDGTKKCSAMNHLAKDIFVNLFSNAVKFDNHETVEIGIDLRGVTMEKVDYWQVSVSDHGPGIDDALKTAVFDRFIQGPSTSIGTGLGLHIAKTLVTTFKGKIWAEDRVKGDPSKGSVFKVLLPKSKCAV
jgi:signal transduction histidine kinase